MESSIQDTVGRKDAWVRPVVDVVCAEREEGTRCLFEYWVIKWKYAKVEKTDRNLVGSRPARILVSPTQAYFFQYLR